MPIDVFIDFFATTDIKLRNTMLICKKVDIDTILEFLDPGWDLKIQNGIECRVDHPSVNAKYMIQSQNFILAFYYMRYHKVSGHLVSLDRNLDDTVSNPIIDIDVQMNNELQKSLLLVQECSLEQFRDDLVSQDKVELPQNFAFFVNGQVVSSSLP